ncbi:hypothetical protein BAUCODRAFT_108515 [Baudoinia panamericana UAMH 10762]|uniref:CENP-V/GFA domain-containing protein n=1 Tax=Baudoinia panamericana (strain UAMH 10762) TaxID=717646 RepID=M2NBY8_BAUPA|nr:uncharacterized protein BAUCODRAFT_108515 [Baudoinia panamericana UAMH 10762]EMC96679.1 hypothetical protein BAUCODRAFT_108515 [Baudoinia panamericana UAMH 10762]
MPKGSCLCGEYTHEYTGDPLGVAICHCIPCIQTAGPNGSVNSAIKSENYIQTSGTAAKWTRKGESGKNVTYERCQNCGTIMIVHAEAAPGIVIFKTGTVASEDPLAMGAPKPAQEIYNKNRPECYPSISYAEQKDAA